MIDRIKKIFQTDSPKGILRMWQLALLTLIIGAIAYGFNPELFAGWGAQALVQFSKAAAANWFLYIVYRLALHHRTHELQKPLNFDRENALVIAHAFVTGCVLAAG